MWVSFTVWFSLLNSNTHKKSRRLACNPDPSMSNNILDLKELTVEDVYHAIVGLSNTRISCLDI